MNQAYSDIFNILIKKSILFTSEIQERMIELFDSTESLRCFSETFSEMINYFLLNPNKYVHDHFNIIEKLKYMKRENDIYSYKYRSSIKRMNKKNIRCIFIIYEDKIIMLNIFNEDKKHVSYRKEVPTILSNYDDIYER